MSGKHPKALVIIAVSGRALARSAHRGGWRPTVVDCFADWDTRKLAEACVRVSFRGDGPDPEQVLAAVRGNTAAHAAVVYGGGLEGTPELIEHIAALRRIYGNDAAAVRAAGEPATFFALLDDLGVPHPATRSSVPDDAGRWLCKRKRGCGGGHVRPWRATAEVEAADCYYQAYVEGAPMSALFLADGERSEILGFNLQLTAEPAHGRAFRYGGAVARAPLPAPYARMLEHTVSGITRALGLRGMNSLDFIAGADGPVVLELNPRPGATFELYDGDVRGGLLALHLDACQGRLPRAVPWRRQWARAHEIVYAAHSMVVPSGVRWPGWITDRPPAGERIDAGGPVCSVTALGRNPDRARAALRGRRARVDRWLSEFTTRPTMCG